MKTQLPTNNQKLDLPGQSGVEHKQPPEISDSERAASNSASPSIFFTGNSKVDNHTALLKKLHSSSSGYSLQFIRHLQRTRGNHYVQGLVEPSSDGSEPAEVGQDTEKIINSKRGSCNAIDSGVRQQMERGFNRDLSGVRLHNDSLDKDLNARAFTTSSDIFFRSSEYKPGNSCGRELLAHELTNVVQQGGDGKVQRLCKDSEQEVKEGSPSILAKLTLGQHNDKYEQEADAVAQQVMRQEEEEPEETQLKPATELMRQQQKRDLTPFPLRANRQMSNSTRVRISQRQDPGRQAIQRVLGPPYPFQGIVTTRWAASFRRTASRRGSLIANLSRNTRVTAIGNTRNWLEVQVTINGRVERGFISQELVGHIPAAGFAPAVTAGGRVEVTDFGTYNVYPSRHRRALQANELYEEEFQRLQTAWTRVGNNTGGMQSHGAAADLADMREMIGRGMASSQVFRNLIIEITEDAGHPVTLNVGRNNAFWLDEFNTNRVDVSDLEFLDEGPRPGYEWAFTQGEDIVHWLAERRHSAVHGGGFAPAHAAPLSPGGIQEQYRADIGQIGRIVSQVRHGPAGGLHAGVYTDDSGNIMRIRRDGSGGHPVPYQITCEPAGGGAVDTRRNNIAASVSSTNANPENLYLKFTNAGHDVSSPVAPVDAGTPLNFATPLGRIVPTGASVDVELYKKGWWIMPDTLVGTLTWAHPFQRGTTVISVGGVDYTITSELAMEP